MKYAPQIDFDPASSDPVLQKVSEWLEEVLAPLAPADIELERTVSGYVRSGLLRYDSTEKKFVGHSEAQVSKQFYAMGAVPDRKGGWKISLEEVPFEVQKAVEEAAQAVEDRAELASNIGILILEAPTGMGLGEELENRLKAVVSEKLADVSEGIRNRDLDIQDRLEKTKETAARMAESEVFKNWSTETNKTYQDRGNSHYVWVCRKDSKVRHDHADLHGRVFAFSEPPIEDTATGHRGNPGDARNCRCRAQPLEGLTIV